MENKKNGLEGESEKEKKVKVQEKTMRQTNKQTHGEKPGRKEGRRKAAGRREGERVERGTGGATPFRDTLLHNSVCGLSWARRHVRQVDSQV